MSRPPTLERDRLRDFARAAVDGTWEVDAALRLVALTDGATRIASQPYMFVIGQPITALGRLLDGPGGEPPLLRAQRERQPVRAQIIEASGCHYRLDGVPLFEGGDFSGFRGVARLEEGAPADLSAERMVGAMSHELRTPLTAIIGFAEAMALGTQGPLSSHYVDYARDIASAGRHLLSMIDDLLDVVPEAAGDAAPGSGAFDLIEVVDQAKSMVALRAVARRQIVEGPTERRPTPVFADRRRTLQILLNLLTNAVKFTPEGGRIQIEVQIEGAAVLLTVADTGPGIAEADREHVFGEFARGSDVKAEGSGLGLHISRELARRMGGDLLLDGAHRPGARFVLRLPGA